MKVVVISDTHFKHSQVKLPDGDLLVHAGDATNLGRLSEVIGFAEWFKDQAKKYKYGAILIAGNHDFMAQIQPDLWKRLISDPKIHYLENSEITIEGIKFWGTPIVPVFGNWAFNTEEEARIRIYNQIPNDVSFLISHGPPYGICDSLPTIPSLGCKALMSAVLQRKSIKYHVFGHIHFGYGTEVFKDKLFINAAQVDESYNVVNVPIIVDVYKESLKELE